MMEVKKVYPVVHNVQVDDNFDGTTRCSCGWKFKHGNRLILRAESHRHVADILQAAAEKEKAA